MGLSISISMSAGCIKEFGENVLKRVKARLGVYFG